MSPTPSTAGRPPGTRRSTAWRWSRRLLGVSAAVIAALIISFVTVDLGRIPGLRGAAERAATNYLNRPMHIGKIEVRPGRGEYVLRDVVIDGLPGDKPHLQVKTIIVKTSLRTLLQRRQMFIDVEVRDWTMLIEKWADHHNLPRYMGPPKDPNKKKEPGAITYRTSSRAFGGKFIYEDHTTPWRVEAPNIGFAMDWSDPDKHYAGTASFAGGTVQIQDYLPMSADMKTRFAMDGGKVTLPHMDLKTDGADTHVTGNLDFGKWPEQSYSLNSDIDLGRMKQIFFAKENWRVKGNGHFTGMFNIYNDERGRDLSGDFTSDLAEVNDLKFPNLHGSLVWLPHRFAVTHADADFLGGDTRFAYAVEPLGTPLGSTQKFVADFDRISLREIKQFGDLKGLELAGLARGHITMAWPSGHLSQGISGSGELSAVPPDGVALATNDLPARLGFSRVAGPRVLRAKDQRWPALAPLPVGGSLAFRFDPEGWTFREGAIATPTTFISLQGRYGYEGAIADFPFHVTSRDWQESDRLLAAIITAVSGTLSTPVEVGGVGTFDGRMTGSFKAPRVEGCFTGDEMYAWAVNWGRGEGDVVIENKYLDLSNGVIARGDGTIRASGRFALGFPRADGGEEINAKIGMMSWPLADLSLAFGKTDWPIDGTVAESTLDLHGKYDNQLFGTGPKLKIVNGVAWKEKFDVATGDLTFNGPTVDIANFKLTKGTGTIQGTAQLGWDSTYEFDVTGERIAIESLDNFKMERVPLSGIMSLNCSGKGPFDHPFYKCTADAPDLSADDQVIGQTKAQIFVQDNVLQIEKLEAISNRLNVFTTGQIILAEPYMSTLSATFKDASVDPYLKFVTDRKISDLVKAVVFGTATVSGPLSDPMAMDLTAKITQGTLFLYDYQLTNPNDEPIEFTIKNKQMKIGHARLTGKGTDIAITGGFADSKADLRLDGKASLDILKSPGRVSVSDGEATLQATVKGPLDNPQLSGTANIKDGVFRWGTLPSLTDINGTMTFDGNGVNADGLSAKVGAGDVVFGGNVFVDLDEFKRSTYDLTATGRSMILRYPEGFQSKVDADLTLTGPLMTPTLGGTVNVISATYLKRFETDAAAILGLAGGPDTSLTPPVVAAPDEEGATLITDVHIIAPPSTLHIDSGSGTHLEGSGFLDYKAQGDRASLLGRIEIDRGFVTWNSNKFVLQSATIGFDNPSRIEPNFSVSAAVRPHAPGQTFDVGVNISGTMTNFKMNLSSDPWLSEADIIQLLLGQSPDKDTAAETRALKSPQSDQMVQNAAAQILFAPISSRVVGSVIGDIPGAPTVSISPVIGANISTTATARVVVGKQISSKIYISYMRTLNQPREFILLEIEQSERLSWILSKNEDQTFALDFRIRHVF